MNLKVSLWVYLSYELNELKSAFFVNIITFSPSNGTPAIKKAINFIIYLLLNKKNHLNNILFFKLNNNP